MTEVCMHRLAEELAPDTCVCVCVCVYVCVCVCVYVCVYDTFRFQVGKQASFSFVTNQMGDVQDWLRGGGEGKRE